ncbi:uncharacterized protein BO97DRAFT_404269 [Aspergillus homomorphus CBS 101889]|uniref:Uncharacterized protein n=1 Tax=Aspergillus homomorphus (strain CBS 101889) TaxID=1450537 RepID=A0A395I532_ASPHC|nr:hypothetical protein BO97DRAFT_404269 [Aspergillus homomorphus CBS 101889]RAL14298.1 hypothetical protein BO97DRAFT_404269 [Aspergillus homomorphus CBS 101889]
MHTSRTMSPHAKRKQIWEQVVPDIATKKEYLMHLLLALAGEHLLYEVHMSGSITAGINESQSALPAYDEHELQLEYHRVIQHHQRGLEGFRQALADISPDTAEYVFCGALLIVAIAFASISTRDQDCPGLGLGKQDDDQYPYIDWLHLVRGLTSIVQEHWLTLKLGRLRAMLFYIYANDDWKLAVPASSSAQFSRLKHAPQVFHVFVQGATQAIRMLRAFAATLFPGTASLDGKSISTSQHSDNEQASEAEDHPYDYTHAIGKLEEIYMRILYVLQFSRSERDCAPALEIQIDIEDSAVTSWPYMISNSFFDSLKSREQLRPAEGFSYAILAHFYVVSLLFPDVWYLNSGFRSEIEKILLLVNKLENHALSALMAWPMAVIAGS